MSNIMVAQFNKMNKEFITLIGGVKDISGLNHDHYLYSFVTIDEESEKIVGNYDNFEVKKLVDMPSEITEQEMDMLAHEKIVGKYPIAKQLNVLSRTLEALADRMGVNNDELKEMNAFIDEVRRVNSVRKQYFSEADNFEYISDEDLDNRISKKYAGGISGYTNEIQGL